MFEERDWATAEQDQTVNFTQEDREDAVRLLTLIIGKVRADQTVRQFETAPVARALLDDRKRRSAIFNPGMFGEPAWELLLNLYITDQGGPRLTIGKLIQVAGLPQSTSLRWLDYLEDQKLIVRNEHPTDARTAFVELTDKAREALASYLSQMLTPKL
jgi:DNA-binding MarR family transcriptional regulator